MRSLSDSAESQHLINLISTQTLGLLEDHWPDILECRGDDDDLKITFSHTLSIDGSRRTVKSQISFARRFSDQIEDSFDTTQTTLSFADKKK